MIVSRPLTSAALLLAFLAPRTAHAASRSEPSDYKGAVITDAATGAVLFERNADEVSPPASMTKLMTYAVLVDVMQNGTLALSTKVTVTAADAKVGMWKDSTSVWLRQNEVFTVDDLIYAMMIQSANDAAYALAFRAAGSVDAFVGLMNAKARQLGMTRSTFRSPHGFPPPGRHIADGDLTTPRDFAILCRYLLLHSDVLKYTSVKTRLFGAGVRLQPSQMSNHNHLLGKIQGMDGLKTGFTNGAGFCLSATVQRNGRRIIVVVMDSPDPRTRDVKVVPDLIARGFELLPPGGPTFPARPTPPGRLQAGPLPAGANSPLIPASIVPAKGATAPAAPPPDEGPTIRFPVPGGR